MTKDAGNFHLLSTASAWAQLHSSQPVWGRTRSRNDHSFLLFAIRAHHATTQRRKLENSSIALLIWQRATEAQGFCPDGSMVLFPTCLGLFSFHLWTHWSH